MSKIGRKPIAFSSAKVEVSGRRISIQGSLAKVEHQIPESLEVKVEGKTLLLSPRENSKTVRALWGLHRALLANKIRGVESGFEYGVKIVGLGYKVKLSGKKMEFSLGFSHKVTLTLPEGVTLTVDKTGQKLVFKSHDKQLLGATCDKVRSLRPPEPYKGTGIMLESETIKRKAGKTGV